MINILNKEDCCGCTACASICPQECITMIPDEEGFWYPYVNTALCINCNLCESKCPLTNKEKIVAQQGIPKETINYEAVQKASSIPDAKVCFIKDSDIRVNSTSGGFFTAISNRTLKKDGIVCGVIIDKSLNIIHSFAENGKELEMMRRSKYVQSNQEGIFNQIKTELIQGREVLYSGTPCQVAGLKSFLGKEYDNLLTVDIFCHGVGSPLVWKKYTEYASQKMGSQIKEVRFREKTYGYNSGCLCVYFENGKSYRKGHDDDLFWSAFSKNFIFRPSCYACGFKELNHISDFSIGDFWDTTGLRKEFSDANGCTLLLCHSQKAKDVLSELDELISTDIEVDKALNVNGGHQSSMLITSAHKPVKRDSFMKDIQEQPINIVVRKHIPLSLKNRIKSIVKPVLFKIGILEKIKRVLH